LNPDVDPLLEESQQLYEDIAIINNPAVMEQSLKRQYEQARTITGQQARATQQM
jgi:hypothetical protein